MFRQFFLFLLSLLFINISLAETASDHLTRLLEKTQTMTATFDQTIRDKSGHILQRSQGKMFLSRPGQFRWETKKPIEQIIIANQKKLWVYDPDLEQVIVRSLNKEAGETPALLLSDTGLHLEKKFIISNNKEFFLLTPKDNNHLFSLIKLHFVKDVIKEMQLQDHLGQITTIHFSDVKTNTALQSSLFHFTPPSNVDVIDET